MKNNVDLTLDRRFSRMNTISVHQLFEQTKKPWEPNQLKALMNKINDPTEQIVLTGNKEDRAKARYYKEMPERCDRCGRILDVPWRRRYSLCVECNDWLDEECDHNRGAYIQRRRNNKYKNFRPDVEGNLILNH